MPKIRLSYGENEEGIILRGKEAREYNLGVVVDMPQEDIDFIKNAERMYGKAIDLAMKHIRKNYKKET